jgi:hypothetical protein
MRSGGDRNGGNLGDGGIDKEADGVGEGLRLLPTREIDTYRFCYIESIQSYNV